MSIDVECEQCGESMTHKVKPNDEWTPLPKDERPTMIPFAFAEWVCANGHHRDLSFNESRSFE